ncbi:DCC1-like thiol-disulfide oxidoreductase family protein [Methylomonas sp. SURF-2]|uniref:DCC1-like thiol-disulfide oxidoreductase family protein n=1 Tax=Methylomonas subterranea TaxID=2952225 RepID=A0ABT1TDM5_9GAMM|nr:DCC1-like thiol-disulfide oxidoreductase family protein [Methylomonas sp. SURF-2]MCQ8103383.1 DCC1-like thiol-disulfide oxidoreductase family protein [Methylomonas sp. SURF-2]
MSNALASKIYTLFQQQAPATGIGLFRLLFGLITLQEILFLIYFNHLIFDPIPYMDVEFPMITFFLWLWAAVAFCLVIGYRCQASSLANYVFWLVFVNFTPMQRDFDGGFDLFMIGANFFLIFMPMDKAFAIDGLRKKLATPFTHYSEYPEVQVSRLAYYLPVLICLGFLYFDSAIHKMFAEHWRNGLGAWLPSSMPYYISALDMSWLLNMEPLQKLIGYTIIVFQFSFIPLFHFRLLRPLYFLTGLSLHLGIALSFNIYPFGMGMLIFYVLMVPFAWYRRVGSWLRRPQPVLTVFFDQYCPLCNRTVLILNHFDILHAVDFKPAQTYARAYPALDSLSDETLLTDLYALDGENRLYAGVDTYAQILVAMGYTAVIGWIIRIPGIHAWAKSRYRRIADNRARLSCDANCIREPGATVATTLYERIFADGQAMQQRRNARKLGKVLLIIVLLQLNSSIHYGLLYRLKVDTRQTPLASVMADMSNAVLMFSHTFLGITPHALYLHDHFEGYDHVLAITYLDANGVERWLPFVNEQGRLLAPNWGRVHSMWANIAVTPNIDEFRLKKFIMKITAFWGKKLHLDFEETRFIVKMKKTRAPFVWERDLRNKNLAGEWRAIGSAQWAGKEFKVNLPNDIDML